MTPPEVVLDRIVRNELRHEEGCSGYSGKIDIDRIEPESLRCFLYLVQSTMDETLRLEGSDSPRSVNSIATDDVGLNGAVTGVRGLAENGRPPGELRSPCRRQDRRPHRSWLGLASEEVTGQY